MTETFCDLCGGKVGRGPLYGQARMIANLLGKVGISDVCEHCGKAMCKVEGGHPLKNYMRFEEAIRGLQEQHKEETIDAVRGLLTGRLVNAGCTGD